MKFRLLGLILIIFLVLLQLNHPEVYAMEKTKHVLLLGASVGKAWKFEELPQRMNMKGYQFEYEGEYQFDKTKALKEILTRKDRKPAVVLIKECAAYFPGDLAQYQKLMIGWVKECRASGVIPIPTTVVPVIKDNSFVTKIKDIIKRIIGRSPHDLRLTSILKYNDWIKAYAQKEGLVIFDLEAPLRISPDDRSLRLDLHSGDGLHLNSKAYGILDKTMGEFISQTNSVFK
jgi:hypothetical protein